MENKKAVLSRLAVGALTLLLSGCASTAREESMMLRDKEPLLSEATERPAADYIGCLNPKMVAIGLPVQLMQDGSSTVLRMSRFANPVLVVEVSPNSSTTGANVQLRARFNGGWGVGATVEAAKACL